jgi:hypothetical protein
MISLLDVTAAVYPTVISKGIAATGILGGKPLGK